MEIIKPDDFHIHIRQGKLLSSYLNDYAPYVKRIVPMPNTIPAIDTPTRLIAYQHEINNAKTSITPLMIFKLHDKLNPNFIKEFKTLQVIAAKLYPVGATTNATDGVSDVENITDILSELERNAIPLSIHAELMTSFSLNREFDFLTKIQFILKQFPKLKIIIEHLSDRRTVDFIEQYSKTHSIAGTITVHHLYLDLDDILGNSLIPHHFCKPIVKTPKDKQRLLKAAFSGNPCFFFGSDSAPHLVKDKEKNNGSAGIYTAPVAIPLLFDLFDKHHQLDKLEAFTSIFGANFYNLSLNKEKLTMIKQPWTPNKLYSQSMPFYYGKEIAWQKETS